MALVTKSGTNNFHGSAYEYLRNTYTSANDYFNKLTQLSGCSNLADPNVCNKAPKLIRNIFGASFGGPLKKDRLFIFMNYEGTRRAEETVSAGEEVPSLAMRDGVLQYLCTTPSQCPGGSAFAVHGMEAIASATAEEERARIMGEWRSGFSKFRFLGDDNGAISSYVHSQAGFSL